MIYRFLPEPNFVDEENLEYKCYLGDGAYVGYDGYHVVIYTSDGVSVTNEVALEPKVLENFKEWIAKVHL